MTTVEPDTRGRYSLVPEILTTGLATFSGLLVWESLKEYAVHLLFPHHEFTRWESHSLTILFGTIIACLASNFVLRGRRRLHMAVVRELDEHRRTNEKLMESEQRYRMLFDRNLAGVYRSTLDGRILECNQAFARIFGYGSSQEVVETPQAADHLYFNPEERKSFISRLRKDRGVSNVEFRLRRKDGTMVSVMQNATLVADEAQGTYVIDGALLDITDHKRLELQLRQAQKMEAVGRLAGGLAHDFNNLLVVIKGNSEMILDRTSTMLPVYSHAEQVKKAADRAADLTRQLLAFSRMQVLEPTVLELNTVLLDMGKMLPRLLREDIEVVMRPGASLGRVKADRGQVEQVILNLAVNARDAMPNGGKLVIETANAEFSAPDPARFPAMLPGKYVMLALQDTGVGMDAETQAHIFEPFFTTKEKGKGTGLGLATVYGVVKQSGGWIWVSSEVGKGTTFQICLPQVEEQAVPAKPARSNAPVPRGSETILVVEDQDGIRRLAVEFLHGLGYTVLQASQGEEALKLLGECRRKIDLMLTDVVMPKMGGRELVTRIAALQPGMTVLYMSGYTEYSSPQRTDPPLGELIPKPFSLATLGGKVREMLDRDRCVAALSEPSA